MSPKLSTPVAVLVVLALVGVGTALTSTAARAAEASGWPMDKFDGDLHDKPSLQNGAKLYMNYCFGCHSLKFQRYQRMADDLGMPYEAVQDNLIFTGQKIGALMKIGMQQETAKAWFGAPPPDLTMVYRVRGGEWLYNYLRAFYLDDERPFGVNNKVFENVGMPHALLELQGRVREGCGPAPAVTGGGEQCDQLTLEEGSGSMTPAQYDAAIYDLVNYLQYVGEPSALQRQRIGVYVLLFLLILSGFTWLLNREYWKDVQH